MDESSNPFLRRTERTKNLTKSHHRSKKQEREVAKRVGGRLTPASGARDVKGDVRLQGVARIECKTTKHKSFSVTLDMVEILELNAAAAGELPIMVIEFNDGNGKKIAELAVCPTYVLDTLIKD